MIFLRIYGARLNPLYQSGTLAVLSVVVALVTGIYLLIFYRVSAPYESVLALQEQAWLGRWMRALHRYSSDLAVVAVGLHVLKMLAQRRTSGPRALAWVSGVLLTAALFFCGWTGFIMVWDAQGHRILAQALGWLDRLPIFSQPPGLMLSGREPVPSSFFFAIMFLHVATPLGGAALLWLHVSRLARPTLFPPRALGWLAVGSLTAISVLLPVRQLPSAQLLELPQPERLDLFYNFWLLGGPALVGGCLVALVALTLVPLYVRPTRRIEPSEVDDRLCTGCTQCYQDCPYDAITMVVRRGTTAVARVNPDACVSCGICAGSCAPMGIGPPGRNGRDQLRGAQVWASEAPAPGEVAVIACRSAASVEGKVLPVSCGGNLHTSVLEYLLRRGYAGVMVVSCPPRDCRNREGPKWLELRVYHDREAELQARVDRRRVRLVQASSAESARVRAELAAFAQALEALETPDREAHPEVALECEVEA